MGAQLRDAKEFRLGSWMRSRDTGVRRRETAPHVLRASCAMCAHRCDRCCPRPRFRSDTRLTTSDHRACLAQTLANLEHGHVHRRRRQSSPVSKPSRLPRLLAREKARSKAKPGAGGAAHSLLSQSPWRGAARTPLRRAPARRGQHAPAAAAEAHGGAPSALDADHGSAHVVPVAPAAGQRALGRDRLRQGPRNDEATVAAAVALRRRAHLPHLHDAGCAAAPPRRRAAAPPRA